MSAKEGSCYFVMNMCLAIPLERDDQYNTVTRLVAFVLLCSIRYLLVNIWESFLQSEKSHPSEEISRTALFCTVCGNGGVAMGLDAGCRACPLATERHF